MNFAILITNYNKIQFIEDAVSSAVKQGVRVVVVDDNSTYGSYEILEKIPDITLLKTPSNSGPSIATKLGADNIDEKYTVLLDGDDALCPNTVEYFNHMFTNHDVDVVYTTAARHSTKDLRLEAENAPLDASYKLIEDPLSHYLQRQFSGTCLCMKSSLLKNALVTDIFVQDIALAANVSRLSKAIILSSANTHFYSPTSPNNITNNRLQMHRDIVRVYLYFSKFPEVYNNKNFSKYTRRIYGSLPIPNDQYRWISPRWKKRMVRWLRRYLMLKLNHKRIADKMQAFLDDADRQYYL